ncbi:MAG: hypothetical protein OSB38_43730, partial [Paraburkholderia fungorum]|nr:hypothetical protein [Paraburkholderia fungorum]
PSMNIGVRRGSDGRRSVAASSFRLLIPVSRVLLSHGHGKRIVRAENRVGGPVYRPFLRPFCTTRLLPDNAFLVYSR